MCATTTSPTHCEHKPIGFRLTSTEKDVFISMTFCRYCKTLLDYTCIPPPPPLQEMVPVLCNAICEMLASLPPDIKSIPQVKTRDGTFDAFL